MVKVTFTLDENTVAKLQDASRRLSKPKSEVVREAVVDYHARLGRLSEAERLRILRALDELAPLVPKRTRADIDRELREIRLARRAGGRRTRVE
ncbi:MAG: ribbon-helix-helix domain-containing protein [Bryobacteraceae bacterium]|jgi:ribbon-helix-helix protein